MLHNRSVTGPDFCPLGTSGLIFESQAESLLLLHFPGASCYLRILAYLNSIISAKRGLHHMSNGQKDRPTNVNWDDVKQAFGYMSTLFDGALPEVPDLLLGKFGGRWHLKMHWIPRMILWTGYPEQ